MVEQKLFGVQAQNKDYKTHEAYVCIFYIDSDAITVMIQSHYLK